ncbi:MAG: hypothetical protein GF310_02705 [candidate division Zixibacteria bacterium]|nr:hypothetical protein [candidate division Zixibacteria bacterium]
MADKAITLTDDKVRLMRAKISQVLKKGSTNWCVACGASAKAMREVLSSEKEYFREIVSEEAVSTALTQINVDEIKGSTSWCVACGAGAREIMDMGRPMAPIDNVMDEIIGLLGE